MQTLRELQKAKHAIKKAQKQSAALKRSRYKLKQAEKEATAAAEREHRWPKTLFSYPVLVRMAAREALRCAHSCFDVSLLVQDLNAGWYCLDSLLLLLISRNAENDMVLLCCAGGEDYVHKAKKGRKAMGDLPAVVLSPPLDAALKALAAADMAAWAGHGLYPPLLGALATQGFTTPTAVQEACLPAAVHGRRDIIGAAQTVR